MADMMANVAKYGWSATAVTPEDAHPGFLYTTGLGATFRHPEIIVFGLDASLAHRICSCIVADLRDGKRYDAPGEYQGLLDAPIAVRPVHASQLIMYFGDTMGFYRQRGAAGDFTAVQLFWPDREGRFPFDPRCDVAVMNAQPRLYIPLTQREIDEFLEEYGS